MFGLLLNHIQNQQEKLAKGIVFAVIEAPDITGGEEKVLTPSIVWFPDKLHLESKAVWALALNVEMYPKVVGETPFKVVPKLNTDVDNLFAIVVVFGVPAK